jgi:hypothetical protein
MELFQFRALADEDVDFVCWCCAEDSENAAARATGCT